MGADFFSLMKYAATGQASPDMTYYDKMRALSMAGGKIETLTGIPPLSFTGNGSPLISWSMKGNGSQTGTPSPQNIIMPDLTGKRTGNLYPLDANKLHVGRIENDGTIGYKEGTVTISGDTVTYTGTNTWRGFFTDLIPVDDDEKLTLSPVTSQLAWSCNCYDENGDFIGKASPVSGRNYRIFTLVQGTTAVRISTTSESKTYTVTEPMLNIGSTALDYEPYGWAEYITCAGQTTPVYLGQVSTVRKIRKLVLTGEETVAGSTLSGGWIVTNLPVIMVNTTGVITAICSHYKAVSNASMATLTVGDMCISTNSANRINFATNIPTAADFKSYLAAQYAAGTPITIWYVLAEPETGIVNEPLCKIGDYADELHIEDAGVTIPTVKGQNTLTVDTDLQPSEMTITYTR